MGEGEDCIAVNSETSSVKTGWVRVSMAGPAGSQGTFGATAAWTVGNPEIAEVLPGFGRETRENAIVIAMSNLNDEPIPLKDLNPAASRADYQSHA